MAREKTLGNQKGEANSEHVQNIQAPVDGVSSRSFPIAGIGASAGGLEAFTSFLNKVPNDSGMAFVLIQHLDPSQPSMLFLACVFNQI